MRYFTRGRGEVGDREISPQRLVYYRNTWYTDAWCHRSEGLRRFALDAIEEASVPEVRAKEVPLKLVESEMDGGYGIYAGSTRHWATLVFQTQSAQWVSHEEWHAEQVGHWLPDGRYELRVPYADEREIAMDVLRHGDQVHVTAPASLVARIGAQLAAASAQYSLGSQGA